MHRNPNGPRLPLVSYSDFAAVDMRVGTVVDVALFPGARNPSLKLFADFGEPIGILGTSAQITNYPLEDLLGRQIIGVINLGIKHIAGFPSEFLVLGAVSRSAEVSLLSPDWLVTSGDFVA